MAAHCRSIACPAEVVAKPSGVRFNNVTPKRFSEQRDPPPDRHMTDAERASGP